MPFVFPAPTADLMPLAQAQDTVDALARHVLSLRSACSESVPIHQALGRRLAEDVRAPHDLPRASNAAMDGYAFARGDVLPPQTALSIAAHVLAGSSTYALAAGTCARIMTGARLPEGADSVLPLELAQLEGQRLLITPEQAAQATHVRARGEELAAGSVALASGTRLTPAALGLAGQLGFGKLPVQPRLNVAVVSCGDELRNPGDAVDDRSQFDGNRAMLMACIALLGAQPIDAGIARDSLAATQAQFEAALNTADVLITTGGAGAGDADHAHAALAGLGTAWQTKLALKPGKPFGLAQIQQKIAIALPGNPVAALVAFEALASRALRILLGNEPTDPTREIQATLTHPTPAAPKRTEWLRARIERIGSSWQATVLANQSSSMLSPQLAANAWVVVEASGQVRVLRSLDAG
jgi:molybdopterin molybdotransferase